MRISPTNWQTQVKSFEKYGCVLVRQKGDHLVFRHRNAKRAVVIPKYDEIPVTIIRTNIKSVGMTREEYFSLLRSI